jgi:RNA polymerase sigma-70 factor (ECF subfamily)
VTVSKYIQSYRYEPGACSFKSWLMHKTQRRIIDQVRKRPPDLSKRVTPQDGTSGTSLLERIPDPESLRLDSVWEEEWQKNLVDAAMERIKRRIKPDHYQIFYLSAVRRLPPKKVAAAMGTSVAQVYLVRHRVSGLIKKEVAELERTNF